jgi:hypothetical protein
MDEHALRSLIRTKLKDGRLPFKSVPRIWSGPGRGETCGACETTITRDQLAIEGISFVASSGAPIIWHAGCFRIWDEESRVLGSAPPCTS